MHKDDKLIVIVVPERFWKRKDLNITEKLILAEIFKLTKDGECLASNKHFSEHLGLCLRYTRKVLSKLHKKSIIEIKCVNFEKRIIRILE